MEKVKAKKKRVDFDLQKLEGDEHAAMAKMYEDTLKNFTEGSIVKGKVLEVRPTEILVDIGYKSEGLISSAEFRDISQIHVGDDMEVLLERLEDDDGMVILSKAKAEQQRCWDRVLETCQEGGLIEGVIKGRVKGGMIVDVGIDAFLPGSQLDVLPVRNPDDLLN